MWAPEADRTDRTCAPQHSPQKSPLSTGESSLFSHNGRGLLGQGGKWAATPPGLGQRLFFEQGAAKQQMRRAVRLTLMGPPLLPPSRGSHPSFGSKTVASYFLWSPIAGGTSPPRALSPGGGLLPGCTPYVSLLNPRSNAPFCELCGRARGIDNQQHHAAVRGPTLWSIVRLDGALRTAPPSFEALRGDTVRNQPLDDAGGACS